MLEIEPWKGGARLAYSIIYEYGLGTIRDYSLPIHQEFMVPANVALVASQIGELLNLPGSPHHMVQSLLGAEDFETLFEEGWSVSSHGMTNDGLNVDLRREIVGSRARIQRILGLSPTALVLGRVDHDLVRLGAYARQNDYLCMFTCLDHINQSTDDLFCLGRIPLMEEGPAPWRRQFDPYDRLSLALEHRGWVVDSLVSACPEPSHFHTEISVNSLARRFEKVREAGDSNVWCAVPEEIVDYTLTRRATRVIPGTGGPEGNEYLLNVHAIDPAVKRRVLTFRVSGLRERNTGQPLIKNLTARTEIAPFHWQNDYAVFNLEVYDGLKLQLRDA